MNQTQAITKLRELLGPQFAYRTDPKASKSDERAAAHEQAKAVFEKKAAAEAAMVARREELLRADQAYQAHKAELQRLQKEHGALRSKALAHPITVGRDGGFVFSVDAQGDNWEEVVAKVERAKA